MVTPGKAVVSRAGYASYIQSPEWRRVRQRYWDSNLPDECYCCGIPRHPGMHLHHRTYKNLGAERLMDLVPVCQPCHEEIHRLYRSDAKWRRKGLWFVTKHVRRLKTRREKYRSGNPRKSS